MTRIDQIKAEIERRIKEWQALLDNDNAVSPDTIKELICEDKNILSFIESPDDDAIPDYKYNSIEYLENRIKSLEERIAILKEENIESPEEEQETDLEKEIEHIIEAEEKYMKFASRSQLIAYIARHFYNFGCKQYEEIGQLPKIKGWVARDKDNNLFFFKSFPLKDSDGWYGSSPLWVERKETNKIFPKLSFDDNPIEVELTISRVSK